MSGYLRTSKMASRRFDLLERRFEFNNPKAYQLAQALAGWKWSPISAKLWEKSFPEYKVRVDLDAEHFTVTAKKHGEIKWTWITRDAYNALKFDSNGVLHGISFDL